jgi:hypothetical protein
MTMRERPLLLCSCGVLALSLAMGCGETCTEVGDCPSADAGGTTDEPEPTTTLSTADETADPSGCDNGIQDGDESDVDCGGSCGNKCGGGQGCGTDDDCVSSSCNEGMTCDPPGCTDGMINGDETDVDCGGGTCPPCDDGQTCIEGPDCQSGTCDEGTCVGSSCTDGMTNGSETDVDCGGGACPPCDDGQMCMEGPDCQSELCDDGTCVSPTCTDGMINGSETDVDCGGGACPPCDDGQMCMEGPDCQSEVCDEGTCVGSSCNDGVLNGSETDVDCGGACGATCEPGEDCLVGGDCVYQGCDPAGLVCNDELAVDATPVCSDHTGMPVPLTATASGGSGTYAYAWTPDDGSLSAPDQAMTMADPPTGFANYSVMVDDGFAMASDDVLVVGQDALNLQNDCNLYLGDISMSSGPAAPTYDMGGTRECESTGNNDLAVHLCEGTSLSGVRLQGTLEVEDDHGDADIIGLVWGAQDSSNFYSLSWKAGAQYIFTCDLPVGITVKRIEAAMFSDLGGRDLFCPENTGDSTVLLDPTGTTTQPWIEGESYVVTIDFTAAGSSVTVERVGDGLVLANFMVADNTYTSGYFGTLTFSQHDGCVGPLLVSCL